MKTVISLIKFLFIAFIIVGLCAPAFAFEKPKPVPGQYIVVFKADKIPPVTKAALKAANREAKAKMATAKRAEVLNKINSHIKKTKINESAILHKFGDALSGYSAKLSASEVAMLKKDADVEGVYQDFEMALGPEPASTTAPSDVTAQSQYVSCAVQKAGGPYLYGSSKITWIWILDTGINLTHPDLNVNTSAAKSFVPGQTAEDGYGHGTHCAGIAAAKNNGFGVVGVSAGAKVVPVKVLSNAGSGYFSWIIAGLNYVATLDWPGDVVSMSLGGYPMTCNVGTIGSDARALYLAIANLYYGGTYVVMAAGNNGQCNGAASTLPGCINQPKAFTVGALNCDMTRAPYSNYGPNIVDWVAVGTGVYSTYKNGGYITMSGTSMATPVVAGIIHARGGPPVSGGNVSICGTTYRSAHR